MMHILREADRQMPGFWYCFICVVLWIILVSYQFYGCLQ